MEAKVLRTLIRGPFELTRPSDSQTLKRLFAFPAEIQDLRIIEKTAKLRVSWREAEASGGLRVEDRDARLE